MKQKPEGEEKCIQSENENIYKSINKWKIGEKKIKIACIFTFFKCLDIYV